MTTQSRSPRRRLFRVALSDPRLAATIVAVSPRLDSRVDGFCGSTSRIWRSSSSKPVASARFTSNVFVPVSSS
ncbi:MAG: hypothetical protein R3F34_20400 [Planctomycetota bacterium]